MYYYKKRNNEFDFGDFTITKREIIASISIIAIMILIGVLISGKISEHYIDKNEIYNKAVKIENDSELFQYGMNTNIGNAFVHGDLEAVDIVSYPEIEGEYVYLEKVKERYTRHTRTVTKARMVNGKSQSYTTTETYWTWDRVDSEEQKAKEISFCDIVFSINKINLPSEEHIDTIKESSRIRYKYYGVGTKYTGTIFTDLRDKTISDNTSFYNNMTIQETVDHLESEVGIIIFWIAWIILTCICVFGFFYIDNRWLE